MHFILNIIGCASLLIRIQTTIVLVIIFSRYWLKPFIRYPCQYLVNIRFMAINCFYALSGTFTIWWDTKVTSRDAVIFIPLSLSHLLRSSGDNTKPGRWPNHVQLHSVAHVRTWVTCRRACDHAIALQLSCSCTHTYVCVRTRTQVRVHVHVCTHVYVYAHLCAFISIWWFVVTI